MVLIERALITESEQESAQVGKYGFSGNPVCALFDLLSFSCLERIAYLRSVRISLIVLRMHSHQLSLFFTINNSISLINSSISLVWSNL